MAEITVIIPTYNRGQLLKKAIQSVLRQSYEDFELIVVDDGSTDNTYEIVRSCSGEKINYIYQENRGAAAARNTGIRAATGEFLAFLDSDDCFAPDKLALQLEAMKDKRQFLVSHTDEIWFRRGKLLNQKKRHARCQGDLFGRCLKLCAVGMSTVMAKRGLFERFGLFDDVLPCCEDYDMWLRVSAQVPFLLVAEPLTIKDGGRPDQLSVIHRTGMDRYRIKSIVKLIESGVLNRVQKEQAIAELQKKCRIYGNGCIKHDKNKEGNYYLSMAEKYSL